MLLAEREMGRTVFESAEYAARGRSDHLYVCDLYKAYLMREPDSSGWAYWDARVPLYGRDQVRRGFDESTEFANLVSTLNISGTASSAVSSLATARVDPFNQPGSGLKGRDAEWSVPLLSLPGRAGLDLGLSLSYSSMVWTRSGSVPYVYFDEDDGFPSPGFRLGFPTIQEKFFDAQAGVNVYLLETSGSRVELRQVGSTNVYEAGDSSYLQLIFGSDTGCIMDGLPTACNRVLRAINNGQGDQVRVYGFSMSLELSLFTASYSSVTTSPGGSRIRLPPSQIIKDSSGNAYLFVGQPTKAGEAAVQFVITPGFQLGFEPNPQNTYDPRADFRDYAETLSKDKSKTDCLKLALMIYKAGQVFGGDRYDSGRSIIRGLMAGLTEYTEVNFGGRDGPSNPDYRVGVFRKDSHYGGGFGDSGFAPHMQDGSNQVRHFTFYLGAGWGHRLNFGKSGIV
ncbi:MAG TPA: DUF4214 domain-containing protein [Pyrinomonadaceae bacterium]|nr:DUF4214 domain-containing protein [Pyrinomonadaceae bacterium]